MVEIVRTTWDKAKMMGIGPSLAERTRAVQADLHIWDRDILKGPKKRTRTAAEGTYVCGVSSATKGDSCPH